MMQQTETAHSPLLEVLEELPPYKRLQELITGAGGHPNGPAAAFGLPEAHKAHVFAALTRGCGGLYITADAGSAERAYAMASALSPNIALFPPRELPLVNAYAASGESTRQRIAALIRLALGEPLGVIAPVEAVMQLLAPPNLLREAVQQVKLGDIFPPRALYRSLCEAGYEPVDLAESPGQVSLRGDILDVYPPQGSEPLRIEFFDDEVDRISSYDAETQRSLERLEKALLPPATEAPQDEGAIARALCAIGEAKGFEAQKAAFEANRACPGAETLLPVLYEELYTLFEFLPENAVYFIEEPHSVEDHAGAVARLFQNSVAAMLERGEGLAAQSGLQMDVEELFRLLHTPRTALLQMLTRAFPPIRIRESVQFEALPAPRYTGDFAELARDLGAMRHIHGRVAICAGEHAERLWRQLSDEGLTAGLLGGLTRLPERGEVLITGQSLPMGLAYGPLQLTVLSEAELYGTVRRAARGRHAKTPRLVFSELAPGDFIVHESHGIGRFVGAEALTVQNHTRDYLLMEYAGGDRLYIPTDQLDRVQKYVGGDEAPKLSKLGGNDWQRQVNRARGAVKELAFDLAKLYAQRQNAKGFAFGADTLWQRDMEEKFPYQETPDQAQSIGDIKKDMESPRVMDRLLCGDVGYGKTEVALRAAFKAVQDSKQVAFLVPTTILAQQHYNTLTARFQGFPVRVALLSRFKTPQEIKSIKKDITAGKVDVVVGTHALLAKDVAFKDLGLLVIDEEQRFGVGHKEQMKTLKENVDVLTLTATPIPRTLHMSMIGIRDMSVIDTPPEDRFPVQTFVMEYSDTLLRDALQKEISRGGQCYVVYNKVQKMDGLRAHMQELLPGASIGCAHGQMPETRLEQTMLEFMEGRYDILLCSTIIENGMDIGNVNTLFVLDADKMGLSQLYQLRGRVGRTARLGYAYFTFARDKVLTEIAHKRLTALSEFARFGSGREIALRDLEIRGAGSLLGAHQHGHIADIGYEYYCKLMAGAVREAQGEEPPALEVDTVIDIPLDAHIPKAYIRNEVQRLSMYKRIAMVKSGAELMDVQEELEDRYGDIPASTQNLMDISLMKALCSFAQVNLLRITDGHAKLLFHEEANLDGGRMLSVAAAHNLQLIPGDSLSLVFRRAGLDAHGTLHALFPVLEGLQSCI